MYLLIKYDEKSIDNPNRRTSQKIDGTRNNRKEKPKTMSLEYKLPKEDEEMVFYFPPEIIKGNDYEKTDAIFYVRSKLETIIKEYNISPDQSIGFVADITTMEFLMVEFILGYMKYWGLNIPDLENDIDVSVPDKL